MLKLALAASLVAVLSSPALADSHDGSHDFDFQLGKWKMKIRKLEHPLSGQQNWLEYTGTGVSRPLWNGRGQLEELEIDSPQAGHLEGLVVRLYVPEAHQWYLNWVNAKHPVFAVPTVGAFKNGRGELYDTEEWNGRVILVRAVWSNITRTSAHFEQAFSEDGGKTWEANWIADETRIE